MKPTVALVGATKSGRSSVGQELAFLLDVPLTENENLLEDDLHDLVVSDPKGATWKIVESARKLCEYDGVVTLLPSAATDAHTLETFAARGVPIVLLTCSPSKLASRANLSAPRPTTLGTPRAMFNSMISQFLETVTPHVTASFSTEDTKASEVAIAIRDTIART
jgi:Shikimate kinase